MPPAAGCSLYVNFRAAPYVTIALEDRDSVLEGRVCQIVCELHLRAFLVAVVVLENEVHHPRAVGCPDQWGPFPACHCLDRSGECRDVEWQGRLGHLGYHAGGCSETPLCGERPRLVGVVGVWEFQEECFPDLGDRLWVYGDRVVPDCMLSGAVVRLGGELCGLHRGG